MPIDLDASLDAAAPHARFEKIFDAPLRGAAQQLIDLGGVSGVRVLQNGRIVTGIAGDRQRVYIQYPRAGAPTIEGECSCGEPSPCVHVAAVAMAAAKISGAPLSRRTGVDPGAGTDPLEFLIDSGRSIHGDYDSWRRREIDSLDDVLMGQEGENPRAPRVSRGLRSQYRARRTAADV